MPVNASKKNLKEWGKKSIDPGVFLWDILLSPQYIFTCLSALELFKSAKKSDVQVNISTLFNGRKDKAIFKLRQIYLQLF